MGRPVGRLPVGAVVALTLALAAIAAVMGLARVLWRALDG